MGQQCHRTRSSSTLDHRLNRNLWGHYRASDDMALRSNRDLAWQRLRRKFTQQFFVAPRFCQRNNTTQWFSLFFTCPSRSSPSELIHSVREGLGNCQCRGVNWDHRLELSNRQQAIPKSRTLPATDGNAADPISSGKRNSILRTDLLRKNPHFASIWPCREPPKLPRKKEKISIFIALMLATLGLFSRILTH